MTDFLLDTITFDLIINDITQIPKATQNIITGAENNLFLSIVSIWELSIQAAQKKITFAKPFQDAILEEVIKNDIQLLDLLIEDTHVQASMPFLTIHGKLHKDPFDRLIVAQAMHRNLPVISCDAKFPFYPITVQWD